MLVVLALVLELELALVLVLALESELALELVLQMSVHALPLIEVWPTRLRTMTLRSVRWRPEEARS